MVIYTVFQAEDCRPETDPIEPTLNHTSISTLPHHTKVDDDDDLTSVDIVIVGGGVAGLYCAYKLLQKDCSKTLMVIEQSDELGGRLQSDIIEFSACDLPVDEDDVTGYHHCWVKEEEGGMRFSSDKNVMPKLWSLIHELKNKAPVPEDPTFKIVPFQMKPNNGCNSNRYSFNGHNFTEWYSKENPIVWSELFKLEEDELKKSPGDIGNEMYKRVMEHNCDKLLYYLENRNSNWGRTQLDLLLTQDSPGTKEKIDFANLVQNPSYWQWVRTHFTWCVEGEDFLLCKFSMTALMVEMGYSSGCIQMLTHAVGFICLTLTPGNAGVVLQMLVTNNNTHPDLKCFKYGFSVLINKLMDRITTFIVEQKSDKDSWRMKGTTVTNVSTVPYRQIGYKIDLKSRDGKKLKSIKAKTVILAIAHDSFVDLFTQKYFYNDISSNALPIPSAAYNSVTGVRMVKINLFFDREWWNEGLVQIIGQPKRNLYGPNTTNLDLGSVYPFYSFSCPEDVMQGGRPAALTIYCDESNARFWSDLQRIGLLFKSELQTKYKDMQAASRPLVKEARRQLAILFEYKEVPEPVLTTFKDWNGAFGENKDVNCRKYNGYAIHQWKLDVDDKKMTQEMVQPFGEKQRIYCCNEAWSDFQGWVEGSLTSADLVLDAIKKRTNPDLIPFPNA